MLLGEVWAVRQALVTHVKLDLFGAIAAVHAVILTILYLRKSPIAGTFLFYSLAPIVPLYLILSYAGYVPSGPNRAPVYVIMAAFWAVGLLFMWREKRKYDAYIAPIAAAALDPAEPRR